jgi:hypothetical protein
MSLAAHGRIRPASSVTSARTRRATRRRRRERRARVRRDHHLRAAFAPLCLLLGSASLLLGGAAAVSMTAGPSSLSTVEVAAPAAPAAPAALAAARRSAELRDTAAPSTRPADGAATEPAGVPTIAEVVSPIPGPGGAAPEPTAATVERAAPPVAVEIPGIGVDASLIELGIDADRQLEVPANPDLAGWFVGGPRPGEEGPAVIAGHVDSTLGPAVFHRVPRLGTGDVVLVHRADGTTASFAVDRVEWWPKDGFPTDAVYREADGAELRLITCGGVFDRTRLSYEDNVIVFASAIDG